MKKKKHNDDGDNGGGLEGCLTRLVPKINCFLVLNQFVWHPGECVSFQNVNKKDWYPLNSCFI